MKSWILIAGLAVLGLAGASSTIAVEDVSAVEVDTVRLGDDDPEEVSITSEKPLASRRQELRRMFTQQDSTETVAQFHRQLEEKMRAQEYGKHKKRKYLEQFRLLKLLELLDLNEDQEVEFIRSFTKLRREMRQFDERRREVLQRLGGGVDRRDMPDDEINRLVDDMMKINKEKRRLTDRFLHDCREHLSAEQVGKFVLFRERFEYELLEQVRCFRERMHDSPNGKVEKR